MLTGVLAMSQSAGLFKVVGGGAIGIAAIYFIFRAVNLTGRLWRLTNYYQSALIWIPGLLAICLAVTGLFLAAGNEPLSLAYVLGVVLFGCELAMLTVAGTDLDGLADTTPRPAETV
ncbi:hypothetical protein J5277_17695 [Rhizobium sp. 16-449-1b]|uniref:hypothetical protein n=1 Tax=Rhizobium sp. 16-449-1b TaxID=2819989 RepID=UPI001ADD30B8|nr:hypothetical protein [Rhizobium sp. 16-449-1b]MBO9195940.1 hypothetical protein [Rhizobium sp. 16-449-1b]